MTERTVPAGQPLGAMFGNEDGRPDAPRTVRLGSRSHELSAAEYGLWARAFEEVGPAELSRHGREHGLADAAAALEALHGSGLLVTFDPEGDLDHLFDDHVLVAQGTGQGNSQENLDEFVICGPAMEPLVGVNLAIYAVWTLSVRHSLREACAATAERLELPDDVVRHAVAEDLPTLVGVGAALLDQCVEVTVR